MTSAQVQNPTLGVGIHRFEHDYQFVPASQTDVAFTGGGKGVGRAGDIITRVLIVCQLVDPIGAVQIRDDTGPLQYLFTGAPLGGGLAGYFHTHYAVFGERGIRSVNGPWRIRTAAGVVAWVLGRAT